MEDRLMMENILTGAKSVCDLMMHGAIESATGNVHQAFTKALDDTICMQNEIYAKMAAKGWYPAESAPTTEINTVKQKYAGQQ